MVVFVLFFGLRIPLLTEQPVEGFLWGAIGGCYGAFSSSIYRGSLFHTTPVSGGASNMNDAVEVARKPPTIAPSLYEFDHATLSQEVQVALDGANRTLEGLGQGFHLGVALAGAVVGIVRKRAVGGDHLSGDAAGYKIGNLRDPGKFRSSRHIGLLDSCGGALW